MSLAAGDRLGPYEISALIGEGGMGLVFQAKDFQLGREVALKVLPEAFTVDPERTARFEREAKLLASLNHPNIAQIYGLESSGDTRALVMELVEGPTLADRLDAGSLPLDESLSIARQIAEALEEAHEKGIIHRDLKPQNVKAPVEGKVKVLDFGLAKAMDPVAASGAASASQLAASPTLTLGATVQGVILGTAAYMSPEQAAGNVADRRSDVWSFGVVLYEMLVGRRLFEGETVSHVLAGVLKEEPDFSLLPDDVPPRVRRLVRRCLRKKPRERLQAIGDARLLIEEAMAGHDAEEVPAVAAVASPSSPPARDWRIAGAGAVAALALGLAAGRLLLAPRAEPAEPLRLELAVPAGLQLSSSQGHPGMALSADGRQLAIAVVSDEGPSGLLLRDFGELTPRRIDGTAGARAPFFSPDGEWVGYFDERAMHKVSARGGTPIRLAEVDDRSRGAVWGRDGFIYFSPDTNSGIQRISEAGGAIEEVTALDEARDERTHRWPDLSPDGEVLIYTSDTGASPTFYDDARIEAVRLSDRTMRVLVEGASEARWLTDDLLVYSNSGNLFVIEIDRKALATRGKPAALEQEVSTNVGSGSVQVALSRAGSAAWLTGALTGILGAPQWYSRDGQSTPAPVPDTVDMWQLALSPDGGRAAVRTVGSGRRVNVGRQGGAADEGQDIWVSDLERGTLTRLTFDEAADHPTWTPDGRRIAYQRNARQGDPAGAAGGREIAWKVADGSAESELLLADGKINAPNAFSPDGRWLVFSRWDDVGKGDLWILPVDPPGEPQPFQVSPFEEFAAEVSPDGRFIAYISNETGRFEVYVRPFPEGSGKWQISPSGGWEPRWSPVGGELLYRTEAGRLMSVEVETRPTFRAATPRTLWQQAELLGGRNPKSYGISPDGQRFLALRLFTGALGSRTVNYSDEWIPRARRLLAPRR